MTNDREHINRKTQFGRNPTSSGSSISVEQTADSAVAAFSHSELHKSSEARIAPLTLTQEMSEEGDGGGAGRPRMGRRKREEEKKLHFSSSLLICCCFYVQELVKKQNCPVSVKTDKQIFKDKK